MVTRTPKPKIRMRVVEMRMVPANELIPAPLNWHVHSDAQRTVLREMLRRIGFAGAALVWKDEDDQLHLIDAHLRREEMGRQAVPTLVTDFNEAEAREWLATGDAIGQMAGVDVEAYRKLVDGMEVDSGPVRALLEEVAAGGHPQDIPADAFRDQATGQDDGDGSPQLGTLSYKLVIECRDEDHQAELLQRLEAEGLTVKVLVV